MILVKAWLARYFESVAHSGKVALEGGTSIGSNYKAEADAEEDMLHENRCEGDRVDSIKLDDHGESGEVAYRAENILGTIVGRNGAWLPYINVDNGKGG